MGTRDSTDPNLLNKRRLGPSLESQGKKETLRKGQGRDQQDLQSQ